MDWMQAMLDRLGAGLHETALELTTPDGDRWRVGRGPVGAVIRLRNRAVLQRILSDPLLVFGEEYVAGGWEPGDAGLLGVLEVVQKLRSSWRPGAHRSRWQKLLGRLAQWNDAGRSERNVARHYDLDRDLFAEFLDRDLHYSCAYYRSPEATLEDAQQEKCAHIARKLDLAPDAHVLDIGCGFGSLAMYLAEKHGARVTGITLSRHQLEEGRRRVASRGLEDHVTLEHLDYRKAVGAFDAVVSVGMFEHVGKPQYRRFFRKVLDCMKPDGTALVHTIGLTTGPENVNPWIRKYIFPGGHLPSASEFTGAIERSGLVLADLEVWRLHYAYTLAEWRRRFNAAWGRLNGRLDERFHRMWNFYLAVSEAGFRWGPLVVFQAQLVRDRGRLPITRDYLSSTARNSASV